MNLNEIFEEIAPYLSDSKSIKELLDKHKERDVDELIEEINKLISESDMFLKTDLRILLTALLKHS
jgi:hypothetical protein